MQACVAIVFFLQQWAGAFFPFFFFFFFFFLLGCVTRWEADIEPGGVLVSGGSIWKGSSALGCRRGGAGMGSKVQQLWVEAGGLCAAVEAGEGQGPCVDGGG
ncbi:hypothetical protein RchiOBHm_Chr6g0301901 [Rosa chinensis]|uniref:Uncharacterized protein n=1 Tax=Rosa chinensis TaxID=74649 RepID=A0A2P6PYU6_ROSCH|nr:hypothetical protein RchiOBHm_Chr6g0301901 [Rosa chinensis]